MTTVKDASQFQTISQDIELNAYATYLLSLIDEAFPDGEPIPRWYNQAQTSLKLIDDGLDPAVVTNITEVQLLQAFGVQPEWRGCVIDGRNDLPLDYSEQYGGVLCRDHWYLDRYRFHVLPKAMYLLRWFSVVDLTQLHSIQVSEATKKIYVGCWIAFTKIQSGWCLKLSVSWIKCTSGINSCHQYQPKKSLSRLTDVTGTKKIEISHLSHPSVP